MKDDLEKQEAMIKQAEERFVSAFRAFANARKLLKTGDQPKQFVAVFDSVQLCIVYDLDLTLLARQLLLADTRWRRNLNARLLAMTLWECLDDVPIMCGLEFRRSVADLTLAADLRSRLDGTMKEINRFKKAHGRMLKNIRDVSAAHRDLDLERLFDVVQQIDSKHLIELSKQLTALLGQFYLTMKEVIRDAKELVKLAKHLIVTKPS